MDSPGFQDLHQLNEFFFFFFGDNHRVVKSLLHFQSWVQTSKHKFSSNCPQAALVSLYRQLKTQIWQLVILFLHRSRIFFLMFIYFIVYLTVR